MSLDQFTVFAAVAKHRNVTRASQELHLSQPAVTKQLRLLEEHYDAKLYTRGGPGIELTETGKVFLKTVKGILKQHDRLTHRLSRTATGSKPESLTVGGSYSQSTSLLPSLLARFKKSRPQIQLHLRADNRLAVERMALNGEVDLAVITNLPIDRRLTIEPYRSEPLVAFVTPHHPLAGKKRLGSKDLRRVGFIVRSQLGGIGASREYIEHLRKNGFKPNVIMQCNTPWAVKEAVRAKMGVGILYRDAVADDIKRGEFRLIKLPGGTFKGKSFIIYRKNAPLSPLVQEFLKLLKSRRNKV